MSRQSCLQRPLLVLALLGLVLFGQVTDGAVQVLAESKRSGMADPPAQPMPDRGNQSPSTPPPASSAVSLRVPISISRGFWPVGFKLGVIPRSLPLSSRPGPSLRRLPVFRGDGPRFGRIDLANHHQYAFALDTDPRGYRLYVDLNRNGDLTDDGPPLPNRGRGRFANLLKLPLAQISGLQLLQGDMELWIFTTEQSWHAGSLLFYNRTQLAGQLQHRGRRYALYLTDNLKVDGNYRNDGISIDINGDGRIDRQRETLSPGETVTLQGDRLQFQIVP